MCQNLTQQIRTEFKLRAHSSPNRLTTLFLFSVLLWFSAQQLQQLWEFSVVPAVLSLPHEIQKRTPSQAHLGSDVRQLSILQPPQHITGGVTSDAKAERVKRREQLPPHLQTDSRPVKALIQTL